MEPLSPLEENAFIKAFCRAQKDMATINLKNGFTEEDLLVDALEVVLNDVRPDIAHKYGKVFKSFRNARIGLKLALVAGELCGETLEAVRKNMGPDDHCPDYSHETVELADAVIRIMNYATDRHLPLAQAVIAKNQFNRNRMDHSKTVRESEHGKRF
jgi:NTP pyrophosphatase (non-canonical NTP hydrolase)